jgi:hypothetical protein
MMRRQALINIGGAKSALSGDNQQAGEGEDKENKRKLVKLSK